MGRQRRQPPELLGNLLIFQIAGGARVCDPRRERLDRELSQLAALRQTLAHRKCSSRLCLSTRCGLGQSALRESCRGSQTPRCERLDRELSQLAALRQTLAHRKCSSRLCLSTRCGLGQSALREIYGSQTPRCGFGPRVVPTRSAPPDLAHRKCSSRLCLSTRCGLGQSALRKLPQVADTAPQTFGPRVVPTRSAPPDLGTPQMFEPSLPVHALRIGTIRAPGIAAVTDFALERLDRELSQLAALRQTLAHRKCSSRLCLSTRCGLGQSALRASCRGSQTPRCERLDRELSQLAALRQTLAHRKCSSRLCLSTRCGLGQSALREVAAGHRLERCERLDRELSQLAALRQTLAHRKCSSRLCLSTRCGLGQSALRECCGSQTLRRERLDRELSQLAALRQTLAHRKCSSRLCLSTRCGLGQSALRAKLPLLTEPCSAGKIVLKMCPAPDHHNPARRPPHWIQRGMVTSPAKEVLRTTCNAVRVSPP